MANKFPGRRCPSLFQYYCRWTVIGLGVLFMAACSQQIDNQLTQGKTMAASKDDVIYMDVALFSYLDRPIFDVFLNGSDIGVAAGQPHWGEAYGLMTGVPVHLGSQTITWRFADTGETVTAKNKPLLTRPDPKFHYLGVHIYPDNTVELIPEEFWPEKTEKGEEINRQWEAKHGQ